MDDKTVCDLIGGIPLSQMAVVAAHPDDEAVGLGASLPALKEAHFVFLTDGAPKNNADARAKGFADAKEYAAARHGELERALSLGGVGISQIRMLGIGDQEAAWHLREIAQRITEIIFELSLRAIITHPYEGGHPDHDAAAFAVHAACRMAAAGQKPAPALFEMTSYHGGEGGITPSEFLPRAQTIGTLDRAVTVVLTKKEKAFKRALFDCYGTQRETLAWFPVEIERFRQAPAYDFTRPPHAGRLFYENYDWGITGARFCERASNALRELGLKGPL